MPSDNSKPYEGLFDIRYKSPDRDQLVSYLRNRKEADPSFTILDVGGSMFGWSASVVDFILDINLPSNPHPHIKFLRGNINRESGWNEVLAHVAEHGKFSFVLCTHTLEDIALPAVTLDMLPRVAHEGFIAVPSKYREFANPEHDTLWKGYIHHRWICDVKHGIFNFYPKLNFIERYTPLHVLGNMDINKYEIAFRWRGKIPYRIMNDDFIGPSALAVVGYYNELLD